MTTAPFTDQQDFQGLFSSVIDDDFVFFRDYVDIRGSHICALTSRMISILEQAIRGGDEMEILESLSYTWRLPHMTPDTSELISSYLTKLGESGQANLALAYMRGVAGMRDEVNQFHPPVIPEEEMADDYDPQSNSSDAPISEEQFQELNEQLEKLQANPTMSQFIEGLEGLEEFHRLHPELSVVPRANKGFGNSPSSAELSLLSMNDRTKQIMESVFSSLASYENKGVDSDTIANFFDKSVNRLINQAFEHTGNQVSKLPEYLLILDEYASSDNNYKSDLYNRVKTIIDYALNYDVSVHGLNVQYPYLRLSQIIPNYYLKNRGFVMDNSACSKGKTGTILLAPVEVNAKATIVVVENTTYTDILEAFRTWYSTRSDFEVLGKDALYDKAWFTSSKNTIIVLDKAFLTCQDSIKFDKLITESPLELLIGDEVHNFKGTQSGNTQKRVKPALQPLDPNDPDNQDPAHTICSRNFGIMAKLSRFRLFSTATPMKNDFSEVARLLLMLLPYPTSKNVSDRFINFRETLHKVQDGSSQLTGIYENASKIYTPLQVCSLSVPTTKESPTFNHISNENLTYVDDGSLVGGIAENNSDNFVSWTEYFFQEFEAWKSDNPSSNPNNGFTEKVFFKYYMALMKDKIVEELKAGNQICFYTNVATDSHKDIKTWILNIAKTNGVKLLSKNVVISNGSFTGKQREKVEAVADDGSTISTQKLVKQVWDKEIKVLITNMVVSTGLDGLQGTDRISGCGRISAVFQLSNSYTKAIETQLQYRWFRNQGADSSKYPDVRYYIPHIKIHNDQDMSGEFFCRTDYTSFRLILKEIKSNLILHGKFPEDMGMAEFQSYLIEFTRHQLQNGTFDTQEGYEARDEFHQNLINEKQSKL